MAIPSPQDGGAVRSVAAELFQQAGARKELSRSELETLLGALGITLAGEVEAAAAASSGELQLSLRNSREFGLVLSAGAAGLDGALDARLFRKGRSSAQALAALSSGRPQAKMATNHQ